MCAPRAKHGIAPDLLELRRSGVFMLSLGEVKVRLYLAAGLG